MDVHFECPFFFEYKIIIIENRTSKASNRSYIKWTSIMNWYKATPENVDMTFMIPIKSIACPPNSKILYH